jgi:hypothetical protein
MTETQDPYNEDFYYIQTMLKKNNRKIQDAILTNSPPPPVLPVFLAFLFPLIDVLGPSTNLDGDSSSCQTTY